MPKINYLFNLVGQSQSDVDAIINNQTLYVIATDDENIQFSENYIPYTIKFMDGDNTILTIVGETGMEVQIPSNPNKEGYVFLGWSTDGIHVISPISNIGDTDIIYKAVWIQPTIVATCNVNESPTDVKICNDTSTIQSIIIDGKELETINTNYTFNSIGNHEIIYTLTDPTQISNNLFYSCTGLTTITIGNSVTSIGNYAFWKCSELTSITIPDSITSIGSSTFGYTGITSINIPSGVTSIGYDTFNSCYELTSITIPNSVTLIGARAFRYCNELTNVTIGNSVTSIADYAFDGCSGLTSITIGNSVTSIADNAFGSCSELTSVTLNSNSIVSKTYRIQSSIKDIFGEQVTEYIIGNSVTSIGDYAFHNCYGLTSVTIGNSVTSIGDRAFRGCSGLTSITIPDSVTSIGTQAFTYCSKLTFIGIDVNNQIYDSRNNCNAIIETSTNKLIAGCKSTIIPNSVTSIGNYAFCGCTEITSITIPNWVTSIGNNAFQGCRGLTNVTIPDSVGSIFEYTFQSCSGLTSVTIPDSVHSIRQYAFANCSGLTSITIPDSVGVIDPCVFDGCSNLSSLTCNATTAPNIKSSTFYGVKTGGTLTVPAGSTGYGVWMGTGDYYLGKYNWTLVEQ